MESFVVSESKPLSDAVLQQIANAGPLDEISNSPGSVRHHLFWHGDRDKTTNTLRQPMFFFIYQTTRHGPQNGFRLCLVQQGFHIAPPAKAEDDDMEDDIDRLEKDIPQGYMEVIILGEKPVSQVIG